MLSVFKTIASVVSLKSYIGIFRPAIGWSACAFPGIAIAVGLTFLTIIGPNLQLYTLAIIDSNYASSYEAIYQNCIAQYPTLGRWLFGFANIIYIPVGMISGLISSNKKSNKDISVSVAKHIFILMTALDCIIGAVYNNINTSSVISNIFSNIVGGAIAGIIIFILLGIIEYNKLLTTRSSKINIISSSIIIISCLIVAIASYYIFKFIYQPIPVQVEAITMSPATGYLATSDAERKFGKITDKTSSFDLIPMGGVVGSMSIKGSIRPLGFAWVPSQTVPTTVSIYVLTNCDPMRYSLAQLTQPTFLFKQNTSFQLGVDGGLAFLEASSHNKISTMASSQTTVSAYWLKKQEKGISQIHMDRDGENLQLIPEGDVVYTLIPSFLYKNKNKNILKPRLLKLFIGGRNFSFLLKPDGNFSSTKGICKSLNSILPENLSSDMVISSSGLGFAIAVKVKMEKPMLDINTVSPKLFIANADGFMTISQIKSDSINGRSLGKTAMISVNDALSDLEVAGNSISLKDTDSLSMQGAFEGQYLEDGRMKLSGRADAVWKNGRRLNLTRWEALPTEWKLGLLAVLGSALYGAWRLLWPIAWKHRSAQPAA